MWIVEVSFDVLGADVASAMNGGAVRLFWQWACLRSILVEQRVGGINEVLDSILEVSLCMPSVGLRRVIFGMWSRRNTVQGRIRWLSPLLLRPQG